MSIFLLMFIFSPSCYFQFAFIRQIQKLQAFATAAQKKSTDQKPYTTCAQFQTKSAYLTNLQIIPINYVLDTLGLESVDTPCALSRREQKQNKVLLFLIVVQGCQDFQAQVYGGPKGSRSRPRVIKWGLRRLIVVQGVHRVFQRDKGGVMGPKQSCWLLCESKGVLSDPIRSKRNPRGSSGVKGVLKIPSVGFWESQRYSRSSKEDQTGSKRAKEQLSWV